MPTLLETILTAPEDTVIYTERCHYFRATDAASSSYLPFGEDPVYFATGKEVKAVFESLGGSTELGALVVIALVNRRKPETKGIPPFQAIHSVIASVMSFSGFDPETHYMDTLGNILEVETNEIVNDQDTTNPLGVLEVALSLDPIDLDRFLEVELKLWGGLKSKNT